jgi:hypothetical protein
MESKWDRRSEGLDGGGRIRFTRPTDAPAIRVTITHRRTGEKEFLLSNQIVRANDGLYRAVHEPGADGSYGEQVTAG